METGVYGLVSLDELSAAPANANKLDPVKFARLKQNIHDEGFLQPILVRRKTDNSLETVDGHHRVAAVRDLNTAMPDEWVAVTHIPGVVIACTDAEAAMLALGMNRLRGELDLNSVAAILDNLANTGVMPTDMTVTGFGAEEIEALLAATQDVDQQVMPEAIESEGEPAPEEGAFVLEIPFENKIDYQLAKRRLKKAAGKGNELSVGLMRVLGEGEEEKSDG